MKIHLECIPCFIKQSLEASRMVTNDKNIHEKVIKEVLKHLQSANFNDSPPELSKDVHEIIRNITQSDDPYKKIKRQSNEKGREFYQNLKKLVEKADDPLLKSIQFAILGNVIDFGTFKRFDINEIINNDINKKFVNQAYPRFKEVLEKSKTILYLADNTGEIFFDKIFLEELLKRDKKIIYAVKANPIINDALVEDAEFAEIDKIAKVIKGDLGQNSSAPGLILKNTSKEFQQIFNSADIVISKGQGNYESLNNSSREIFFLLMIKCHLVADEISIPEGSLVFKVKK